MHLKPSSRGAPRLGEVGISIPELLTATALLLTVLSIVASFEQFEFGTLRDQAIQLNVQSTAQTFVDLFSREVRSACGISVAAPDRIRFQTDLNGDGRIEGPDEDVEYVCDIAGGTVRRVSQSETETVISDLDLSGSRLRYLAADGSELVPQPDLDAQARAAIRRVRVELALAHDSANPRNSARPRAVLMSEIALRGRFFANEIAHPGCVPAGEDP